MNPSEMSGLDLLRAAASGDLPGSSMGKTIPMSFAEVDAGYVMMRARAGYMKNHGEATMSWPGVRVQGQGTSQTLAVVGMTHRF